MKKYDLHSNFLKDIQIPIGFQINPKVQEAMKNYSESLIGIFVHPYARNTVVIKFIPSQEDEPEFSETTWDEYLKKSNPNHQSNGNLLPKMIKSRGVIDLTPSEELFELFVRI
jgi:hypothetical protein